MLSILARWLLFPGPTEEANTQMLQSRDDRSQFTPANSPYGAMVIDPLPTLQRNGLIAVSTLALVSLISSFGLILFITYRFLFWKKYYRRYIGHNQYVVLVYNLALADFIQGLGFIISLRWIHTNSLHASDASCFLQGIWLQLGDPMSGMFVLAIALHTFMNVSLGRQLSHRVFVTIVICLWVFGVVIVVIPIGMYGRYIWVPSVAWCWMSIEHPALRLWTHYFWIFAAQFFTLILYAIMFFQLRRRINESKILGSSHLNSLRRLNRVVAYMVIYPIVYIVLTLPLAAGRMASAHHNTPSVVYFCVAGTLMTLSGFCDTLLYTFTRRMVLEPEARVASAREGYGDGYRKFSSSGRNDRSGANDLLSIGLDGKGPISTVTAAHHRSDSTDAIVPRADVELAPMAGVYQHTTIEVTHEPAYPEQSHRSHARGPEDDSGSEHRSGNSQRTFFRF